MFQMTSLNAILKLFQGLMKMLCLDIISLPSNVQAVEVLSGTEGMYGSLLWNN